MRKSTCICIALAILFSPYIIDKAYGLDLARTCRVMQQNLYVGSNIFKLLEADPDDPLGIPMAVAEIFEDVHATNFPERAEAMADIISARRPDLIALQEVSLIRTQSPGDFLEGNPIAAQDIVYDYLDILMKALRAKKLNYIVAATVENADVEFPILVGFIQAPDGTPMPVLDDARLTDRDVILVRNSVCFGNVTTENYATNLAVEVGETDVTFKRGFAAIDATLKGTTYRFVNTHLEVRGEELGPLVPGIQASQMQELLGVLEGEALPIILAGDLNSSPEDPVLTDPALIIPPYHQLMLSGYGDAWMWRINNRRNPGYTCCQDSDLLNETSTLSERIDHIFVRNRFGWLPFSVVGPTFAWTVGDKPRHKSITGLWTSDHAGVVVRMRIPMCR